MIRRYLTFIFTVVAFSVLAEPITSSRINRLPVAEQSAWKTYLERSETNAIADAAAVRAEVITYKMTNAIKAPSGGDFKRPAATSTAWYATDAAKNLADAVLSFQTPAGGWSKHIGFSSGPRRPGMQWTSQNEPGQPAHYVATFDNGSTTEEMCFLADVWRATKREDCKAGFIKGLDFILAAQFPSGGWPQVYPLEGGYHDDITFNDDAMTHVLELLYQIKSDGSRFSFLSATQRQQAATALARGIGCVLKTQIELGDKKTAWCSQCDALTLQPASARKMEPATLSGLESAHILKFLMTLTNPTPDVVACIESGLQWLEAAKVTGMAKTKVNGKTSYKPNPTSTEIYWARFYDLKTGLPIFPGRDGIVYDTFAGMAAKNKLGYDYYSTQPGSILKNGQKKWRKMLAGHAK